MKNNISVYAVSIIALLLVAGCMSGSNILDDGLTTQVVFLGDTFLITTQPANYRIDGVTYEFMVTQLDQPAVFTIDGMTHQVMVGDMVLVGSSILEVVSIESDGIVIRYDDLYGEHTQDFVMPPSLEAQEEIARTVTQRVSSSGSTVYDVHIYIESPDSAMALYDSGFTNMITYSYDPLFDHVVFSEFEKTFVVIGPGYISGSLQYTTLSLGNDTAYGLVVRNGQQVFLPMQTTYVNATDPDNGTQPHDPVTPTSYEFSMSGDVVTRHAYCGNLYSAYVFFQHYGRTDCSSANNWCQGADINRDGSADDTDLAIIQGSLGASCGAPTQTYYHIPPGEHIQLDSVNNWTTHSMWFRVVDQGGFFLLDERFSPDGSGASPYRQLSVYDYNNPDEYEMLSEYQKSYIRKLYFVHVVDDMFGSCLDSEGFSDIHIQMNHWHHMVLVSDENYTVYLDGEKVLELPGCSYQRLLQSRTAGNPLFGGTGSGDIALAQYYTQPLSSTQVAELYAQQLSAFVGDR